MIYSASRNPFIVSAGILKAGWLNIAFNASSPPAFSAASNLALNFAKNMTWNGKYPVVKLVTQTYELGVKLTKEAMSTLENQIKRLTDSSHETFPDLGKWFIDICYGETSPNRDRPFPLRNFYHPPNHSATSGN